MLSRAKNGFGYKFRPTQSFRTKFMNPPKRTQRKHEEKSSRSNVDLKFSTVSNAL